MTTTDRTVVKRIVALADRYADGDWDDLKTAQHLDGDPHRPGVYAAARPILMNLANQVARAGTGTDPLASIRAAVLRFAHGRLAIGYGDEVRAILEEIRNTLACATLEPDTYAPA